MDAQTIVREVRNLGVELDTTGSTIQIRNGSRLTDDLRRAMKREKPRVIDSLIAEVRQELGQRLSILLKDEKDGRTDSPSYESALAEFEELLTKYECCTDSARKANRDTAADWKRVRADLATARAAALSGRLQNEGVTA